MMGRRESHFAHRFCRLLAKATVAQFLGPEVCWLLTVVAHTEDARHYSGPVTFWNEQLAAMCGFSNVTRLVRARKKATNAGWLNYWAGGKGKAGLYAVTIPDELEGIPDGPSDEDPKWKTNERETEDKRKTSERQAEEKCSTFSPNPNPNPKNGRFAYSPDFETFWKAFPTIRRTKKGEAFKSWKAAIQRATPEIIIAAAERYALSHKGQSKYCQGPVPWLNQGCWDDAPAAWEDPDAVVIAKPLSNEAWEALNEQR